MKLMATTNHSDNQIKLFVFSSSSGSAFKHTAKSSKESLRAWNLVMK